MGLKLKLFEGVHPKHPGQSQPTASTHHTPSPNKPPTCSCACSADASAPLPLPPPPPRAAAASCACSCWLASASCSLASASAAFSPSSAPSRSNSLPFSSSSSSTCAALAPGAGAAEASTPAQSRLDSERVHEVVWVDCRSSRPFSSALYSACAAHVPAWGCAIQGQALESVVREWCTMQVAGQCTAVHCCATSQGWCAAQGGSWRAVHSSPAPPLPWRPYQSPTCRQPPATRARCRQGSTSGALCCSRLCCHSARHACRL